MTHTSQLLGFMKSFNCGPLSYPDDPFINTVRNQIERNPETKLSIEEMARSLYTSKYHFIRNFKQTVGLTPHQFQIQDRVRKAQHMLINSDNTLEAALTAGFCDQSHFIKHFKKVVFYISSRQA